MCRECEIKPVYELTNKRKFCDKCFCNYIEKKVFHTIRRFGMIKQGEKIVVLDSMDVKSSALFYILKKFAKERRQEICKIKEKDSKGKKIAISDNLDDEAYLIVKCLMHGDLHSAKLAPVVNERGITRVKPLYFCSDKESILYAKLKKLPLRMNRQKENKKDKIRDFLDKMEKKHPELKNAIVNAFLEIMPVLKR